jgi:NADH-quinone oxidoreductase subunit N
MTGLLTLVAAESQVPTPHVDWAAISPNLVLMLGGVLLLTVVSLLKGRLPSWFHATWTVLVALGALVAVVVMWSRVMDDGPRTAIGGAVGLDGFSLAISANVCIAVVFGALLLQGYLRREQLEGPEWYVLMMLSASGAVTMATADDLIVLFIGLEIMSVAVYVLAAMHARRISSQEAGMKYFVLGAFSSAFLLYGIALTYGATGSTGLASIQTYLSEHVLTSNGLLLGGIGFMLVGFGFKIAAAPFHFWTPDVYQGSPSPVVAFMATAVKAAAFAALIRVFVVALGPTYVDEWRPMIYALAVLTLIVGSLFAISQTNVKRMLAYSSINHAGFLLLGVLASSPEGNSATLFYLFAYTFMAAGSFAVTTVVGRTGDGHHRLDDYKGLSRVRPGVALVFAVLLLSQAGVPLTVGFLAKFYVIEAALESQFAGADVLAIIAMLTAVISAFMYLRIVASMYFSDPVDADAPAIRIPASAGIALGLAVLGVLVLGVVPGPLSDVVGDATAQLVAYVP